MELSHINERGEATMVDVSDKDITLRIAGASAVVSMNSETLKLIISGNAKKGDVLATARIAGITAAKKTSDLIPLCHVIPLEKVGIDFDILSDTQIMITSYVKCTGKTGVEMEALTSVSCAALTIYDMCKAVDRGITISDIKLTRKSGGKTGSFTDKAIAELYIKRNRGSKSSCVNILTLVEGKGIEGDAFAQGGDRQICMISREENDMLSVFGESICSTKFSPNIIFNGTKPRAGDTFTIGDAIIEITQVGRPCHNLCDLSKTGGSCSLVYNAIFAKVLKDGVIKTGDEMIYV